MSHLTVVGGTSKPQKRFTMNARGVAKFMLSGAYAARRIIESYAFPKEDKAHIIRPVPAKEIVLDYFRNSNSDYYLDAVIAENEVVPFGEKPFEQGRRRSALAVAKHLRHLGPRLHFTDVRKPRPFSITIGELPVRASIDFVAKLADDNIIGVIFNVAIDVSESSDLSRYGRIESEIAWRATREHMPAISQIWYIDALSEQVVRKHSKPLKAEWRNIEVSCQNIIMQYRDIVARRQRANRAPA